MSPNFALLSIKAEERYEIFLEIIVYIQDLMIGEACTELRQMLDTTYPMENGIVRNWEDMGHIWDYTFGPEKLDIDPKVITF